jgi:hypothetical protein
VTLKTHWPLAAIVAAASEMPVGAVTVSVPPQTAATELATVRPSGIVSVKAMLLSAAVLAEGFVIVKVREVVAFSAIPAGLKTFTIEGGPRTLRVAEAVPPVPPSVEVTAAVVLL